MKTYKMFEHLNGNVESVKQGWSWVAFFFTFLWALHKKYWLFAIWTMVLNIVTAICIPPLGAFIGLIYYPLWFGSCGNKWREENLIKRGYKHRDTLNAASPDGAVALYLTKTSGI